MHVCPNFQSNKIDLSVEMIMKNGGNSIVKLIKIKYFPEKTLS